MANTIDFPCSAGRREVHQGIQHFHYRRLTWQGHSFIEARSGWSHQGGFEISVDDAAQGQALWGTLFETGENLQIGYGTPHDVE